MEGRKLAFSMEIFSVFPSQSVISPSKTGLPWFHHLLRNVIIGTSALQAWFWRTMLLVIFCFVLVLCFDFFLLTKLILTGHCSLVANSLPGFPLPVNLARHHKQDGERGSISTGRAGEWPCWGRRGMTSLWWIPPWQLHRDLPGPSSW